MFQARSLRGLAAAGARRADKKEKVPSDPGPLLFERFE